MTLSPESREIRACGRECKEGEVLFLFNEGNTPYDGGFPITQKTALRMDPLTGQVTQANRKDGAVNLQLLPGESVLFLLNEDAGKAAFEPEPAGEQITLDTIITALPRRHYKIGEHNYEIEPPSQSAKPFQQAQIWKGWLGEDFSGEVDYTAEVDIPTSWDKAPLRLWTGPIEYAATVFVDDKAIGPLLWSPWQLLLPPLAVGPHHIIIRVANTLANELTSQRVVDLWSQKKGDGWPSPYHARAIAFERESRGGGIMGPIVIQRLENGFQKP